MKKTLGMMAALMLLILATPHGQDEWIDFGRLDREKRALDALESSATSLRRQNELLEADAVARRRAEGQAAVDAAVANSDRLRRAASNSSDRVELRYLDGLSRAAEYHSLRLDELKAENAELKRELANVNAKLDIVANALADIYDKLEDLEE